ncbi:uncharacterized protein LOC135961232 [Calliphora vicina]|uniref:uncharacterized protein LOC135961232 n=1 Tax=Calliphora vicina TaxID=7373 RepID=UPI00325BE3B4
MCDLQALIEIQRNLLSTVKRLNERFLSKDSSEKTRGYIDALTSELECLFQTFKCQHDEISRVIRETSLNPSDVPYMADESFFEFSEIYFSFKGRLLDSLPTDTTRSPLSSTFAMPTGHADMSATMDARLPKISLPKFSGEYIDWIPFRDIYLSLVHTNASLSKIQKFYYLKGTLTGEAASLIKTISATEANYTSAWNILETRYHNKRAIVGTLIQKLFNIPKSDSSFQSIKSLLDTTQECISSLRNLDIDTTTWDPLLIYLICQKLDLQTRREWEHSLKSSTEVPNRSEMFSFLERTFRSLESLNELAPANTLPWKSKNDFLANRNICRNCLSASHIQDKCNSSNRCGTCKQPHHTVLHVDESVSAQNSNIIPSSTLNSNHLANEPVTTHSSQSPVNVLLYTIRLFVNSNAGHLPLRALLDPGSQGTLISESAVQILRLPKRRSHCKVIGVGTECESMSKHSVYLELMSRYKRLVLSYTALVLSNISSYKPNLSSKEINLPNLNNEDLADPFFFQNDPIDIILGSDVCSKIKIPTESFVHNDLFFQNTYFGWVFSGSSKSMTSNQITYHNVNLENLLRAFWEQEEIISGRDLSNEELACENYFKATVKRNSSGRYVVNLPFRSLLLTGDLPKIHNNMIGALKRFQQLETSFSKRSAFAENYKNFMREYESLGHMTKIGTYPGSVEENSYFLPHHGVFKEESTTTKLRVVFDGSSHIEGRKSLNEELSPGPPLQNDLPTILNKWRKHRIAFSADIEKMFRQVEVTPERRKFQRILWRFSPLEEISVYQLNTLALDYKTDFPYESKLLISDSYVDDIISGANSLERAITLQRNLCSLLGKGRCNLRKWITNSVELLGEIPEEHREKSLTLKFDRDNVVKTLGIQWNTTTDSFSFKVNIDQTRPVSKRTILSETASLYDPLGWLTPSTVIAKSLFKELWEKGIDWDDKIPHAIEQKWLQYKSTLARFTDLRIPRWIHYRTGSQVELHCFCDASTVAYAAAVYARVITSKGIFVNLLQAKSKISPIKTVSIPRLELCAATLLVKLTAKVKASFLDVAIQEIFFWSDSSTVLSWIRKPPSNWTVYVANRVAEIQRLSNPLQWKYVPSALNPVDCASRGIFPHDLMEFSRVNKNLKETDSLNVATINNTLKRLLKITQAIDFPENTRKQILNGDAKRNSLLKLMPFIGNDDFIRVGGRLRNSTLPYDVKHPILLSKMNPLSSLIIREAHENTLHGGITLTMSYVNRKYWIVSGNRLAKKIIGSCIRCFKYSAKSATQIMGNLPPVRLNVTRPFKHSGVDYTGPISVKNSTFRSAIISKGYICLFVCMVTKAIHLEAVSDMTTNAFLAAFRRFVSRRGVCTDIYSDCGTNFIGASKELQVLFHRNRKSIPEDLRNSLVSLGTEWHFIPPASPNFGGLWEAGVKSVKHHLKRVMHDKILSFEELTTLLCQIESCLNSRPLCPLSSDPSDMDALTPAHFIIGEPTNCIPEENLLDMNINRLSRWKTIQNLKQHFWKRWYLEYLNRMQARPRWLKSTPDAKKGDLVLISDDRCGPGQWLMGRIYSIQEVSTLQYEPVSSAKRTEPDPDAIDIEI